MNIRAKFGFN